MTQRQKQLLQLIEENHSISEIKEFMKIEEKEFLRILKSLKENGYSIVREYYANGENNWKLEKNEKEENIEIKNIPSHLKIGVIAESHLGSSQERVDYLEMATDYFEKGNIHYVINGGDFIDGLEKSRFKTIEGQVNYALKKYPKRDTITTFLLLGDHDKKSLTEHGLNLNNRITNKRYDLIPLGYEQGEISIGEDKIGILHKKIKNKNSIYNNKVTLLAHGHRSGSEMIENHLKIYIPPASDIIIRSHAPGFLVLFFDFDRDRRIEQVGIRRMVFSKSPMIAYEENYQFQKKYLHK